MCIQSCWLAGLVGAADELGQLLLIPFHVPEAVAVAVVAGAVDEDLHAAVAQQVVAEAGLDAQRQRLLQGQLMSGLRVEADAQR
jgi:hypothetical protein